MIYRMAGKMGADPAPYSLREWFWRFEAWDDVRQADLKGNDNALRSILAAIINTVAKTPVKPSDLKPEEEREPREMTEDDVLALGVMMGVCNVV